MTLGADDGQTTCRLYFGRQLDVGTTTCHIGGDGYGRSLTGLCYNVGLTLVQLGVEHVVLDATQLQGFRKGFRDFYRSGAD